MISIEEWRGLSALEGGFDPLTAARRSRQDRARALLAITTRRLLQDRPGPLPGELTALVETASPDALAVMAEMLGDGCTVGELCCALNIPASRCGSDCR